MYQLRPYQEEAKQAILREWDEGHRRTLLVQPTASGKTVVMAAVASEQVARGHRVLIMAHRSELLEQAADKLKKAMGLDSVFERAQFTSLGSPVPVTVGSVQSLAQEKRLARFPHDYFQTIIVDECHHLLGSTYQRVLGHFPDANVLGVTATPDRGDQKVLGGYFDSLAYEYTLDRGIREGYLTPIRAQMVPMELDINRVGIANGDFAVGEMGDALEPYLEQIALEMEHYCRGRKTVVFLPLIRTSRKFRDILIRHGFRAAEVNGKSSDRKEILRDFEAGTYNVLCNSMLLTEGWDCPSVDCIVVLRPTRVRSLMMQMVGRGLRLHPGKEHLLLLDFLWLSARHDLCRPSSLIAQDPEVAAGIDEIIANDNEPHDLIEAEERAKRKISAQELILAQELEETRNRKRKLVDPLEFARSIGAKELASYIPSSKWEKGPLTEDQISYLERRGILPDNVGSAGFAAMLIGRLRQRRYAGLSTPKQIRCLERYGFQHVADWKFYEANKMISRIYRNHMRVPCGIRAATYTPYRKEVQRNG